MIVHHVIQGSPEWLRLRLAMPTASKFDRILTPGKLEYAKGARSYIAELLAEHLIGEPTDIDTPWMERGRILEAEARAWYAMDQDIEVREVGFCTDDDLRYGGSPDGMVGDDGIIEIKCPAAKGHIENLLGGQIATTGQVQGLLWITGREWCDTISYNPAMPPAIVRVGRDDHYIAQLSKAMDTFLADLDHAKRHLTVLGERGRREDARDSAVARLRASLHADQDQEAGDPLSLDDIEVVRDHMYLAVQRGVIDHEYAETLRALVIAGRWTRARERWTELRRRAGL
jgi:hypothetical protein